MRPLSKVETRSDSYSHNMVQNIINITMIKYTDKKYCKTKAIGRQKLIEI